MKHTQFFKAEGKLKRSTRMKFSGFGITTRPQSTAKQKTGLLHCRGGQWRGPADEILRRRGMRKQAAIDSKAENRAPSLPGRAVGEPWCAFMLSFSGTVSRR